MQKLGPKNELHKYKYAPDMAVQGAPIRKRELPRAPSGGAVRSRVAPGNLTPGRSQIPDVNLSIHPARATEMKAAAFRQDQSVPPVAG
jgi:hypothetical protein